jgi:hypothetical protein
MNRANLSDLPKNRHFSANSLQSTRCELFTTSTQPCFEPITGPESGKCNLMGEGREMNTDPTRRQKHGTARPGGAGRLFANLFSATMNNQNQKNQDQ